MGSIHEYKMLFDDGLQPIHIICSRWGQKILFLLFRHDLNVAKRCHQTDHTKSTEVQVTIFYVSVFDGMLTLNWVASSVWPHMLSSFCIVALQMLGDPWDNLLPWQRHCPAGHDNSKRLPSVPYNPCIYTSAWVGEYNWARRLLTLSHEWTESPVQQLTSLLSLK